MSQFANVCAGYIGHLFRITGLTRMIYPFFHRLQTRSDKGKIRSRQDISYSSNDNLSFEGEAFLVGHALPHLLPLRHHCLDILHACFLRWTKPLSCSLPLGTLADLGRSKSQLITENALLRKPLIILSRQVKRPTFRKADRLLLLLLAKLVRNWKRALLIVQPDTLWRLASGVLSPGLETQVKGYVSFAEDSRKNGRVDQGNDGEKSTVGC
jgi:hypothetical protein